MSQPAKQLMVGGPLDGKRQSFPEGQVLQRTVSGTGNPACVDPSFVIEEHTYRLEMFKSKNGLVGAWFHSSIKDPMRELLKGYRYHRNPLHMRRPRRPRDLSPFRYG